MSKPCTFSYSNVGTCLALLAFVSINFSGIVSLDLNSRREVLHAPAKASSVVLGLTFPGIKSPTSGDVSAEELLSWDIESMINSRPGGSVNWQSCRYGTSTLETRGQLPTLPPPSPLPTLFPHWMSGYWLANYQFEKVRFPQGRKELSLRLPGVGQGTCLSIPNVGVSPPEHCLCFLETKGSPSIPGTSSNLASYEDVAYNIPRRYESFCPGSKVTAIQTGPVGAATFASPALLLTPKCFVTGEGCSSDVNPLLHEPSTRVRMDLIGPTKRGSRTSQTVDVTLLKTESSFVNNEGTESQGGSFLTSRHYVQYNVEQELQTYYREFISLEQEMLSSPKDRLVKGKLRVAGFLPRAIQGADNGNSISSYDDALASIVIDYRITLQPIDEIEASSR